MFKILSALSLAFFSFAAVAQTSVPMVSAETSAVPLTQLAQAVSQEETLVEETITQGGQGLPSAAPGAPASGVSSRQIDNPLLVVGGVVVLGGIIAAAASSGGGSSTPGHISVPSH